MVQIRVFCDWGCETPLWFMGALPPGDLPISETLQQRLLDWAEVWQGAQQLDGSWVSGTTSEDAFILEGYRLVELLRRELPAGEYEIVPQFDPELGPDFWGGNLELLEGWVVDAVRADPVCATILDRLPELGLGDWWLTAGAVFQNVWNAVEGRDPGHGVKDYDVFYFDGSDLSWDAEDRVIRAAAELFADLPVTIEVRNQARVHLWYEERFGVPIAPFTSTTDAINCFAATTCCVGITRDAEGYRVHVPFGLLDMFRLHLRPNRRLAPQQVYDDKVRQYRDRWPSLTSEP